MSYNVNDYLKYDGFIVSCIIENDTVREGMIAFSEDRMYIFQNVRSGGAPSNMREINRMRGTNYQGSWSAGRMGGQINSEIRSLKVIKEGFSKPKIKEGDVFMTFEGEKFFVHKYFDRSEIILFKNSQDKVCKMFDVYDLKYSLVPEKDFKPIAEKDKFDFYAEDILGKMIYKPTMNDRVTEFLRNVPRGFNGELTLPDRRVYRFVNGRAHEDVTPAETWDIIDRERRNETTTRASRLATPGRPTLSSSNPFVINTAPTARTVTNNTINFGGTSNNLSDLEPVAPEVAARIEAQRTEQRQRQLEQERAWMSTWLASLTGTGAPRR